jgi:hypothetical protein
MDVDGAERLLARIESGEVEVLCRELTSPSPLAQEILGAKPYAFLDDAPAEERRTLAVQTRRFMSPEQAAELVCKAIVEHPREIEPWWVGLTVPALEAMRGPWERANALYYRLTTDSQASARAARERVADDARDDEEAFEMSEAVGPVPGELGTPPGGEPAP